MITCNGAFKASGFLPPVFSQNITRLPALSQQIPDSFQTHNASVPQFGMALGWRQPKDYLTYAKLSEIIRDNENSGVEGSIRILDARIRYWEQRKGFVGFEQSKINEMRRAKAKLHAKNAAFLAKESAVSKLKEQYYKAKKNAKSAVGAKKKAAEDEMKELEKKLKAAESARNSAGNALNSVFSGFRALLGVNKKVKWERVNY